MNDGNSTQAAVAAREEAGHLPVPQAKWLDEHVLLMLGAVAALGAFLAMLPSLLAIAPDPIGRAGGQFAQGAWTTVALTFVAGSLGLFGGTVLGVGKLSPSALIRRGAELYVWAIRGTPLLVQILFVYFALPALLPGLSFSAFWSAVLALTLNTAAYNAEIVRAGIQAVSEGQREAARALGLGAFHLFVLVVLPQAVRISLPALVNNWVSLLKDSSLAYVIGVVEITMIGNRIQAESFQPVPVFVTTACIYLILTSIMSVFAGAVEARMRRLP